MKTNKTWRLPPPEKLSSGLQWFPVVRVGRVVPFGYEQDPNDEDILLPLTEELETLELANLRIEGVFGKELEQQKSLSNFFPK